MTRRSRDKLELGGILGECLRQMSQSSETSPTANPHVAKLRDSATELLKPRIRQVTEAMAEHLFTLSSSSQLSADDRTKCFEAFSLIKTQETALSAVMVEALRDGFETLVLDHDPRKRDEQPRELNLVDVDEFEDSLAIDKIVKAGSERYWIELEACALRLGAILETDPRLISLPFGLRKLCINYREAFSDLELDRHIIGELDRAFMLNLMPELRSIYQKLNAEMSDAGFLTTIEDELSRTGTQLNRDTSEKPPRPNPASKPTEELATLGSETNPTETNHAGINASPPQMGEQSSASLNSSLGAYSGSPASPQALTRGTGATARHGLNPLAGATARSGSAEKAPAPPPPVTPILEGTLEEQAAALPQAAPSGTGGLQGWSTGMLERLTAPFRPGLGKSSAPTTAHSSTAVSTDNMLAEIQAMRSRAITPELIRAPLSDVFGFDARPDEVAPVRPQFAMVDELYQTLDRVIPEQSGLGTSALMAKLPLAELSLTEPGFFIDREHPARLLIERLSELSVLSPPNNKRLEAKVTGILEKLNQDFDGTPAAFDEALSEVTELALVLMRQQQRNIDRQVAADTGRERRSTAIRSVNAAIAAMLPDSTIPKSLLDLIDELWRDQLVLCELNEDRATAREPGLELLKRASIALLSVLEDETRSSGALATETNAALRDWLGPDSILTPQQEAPLLAIERQLLGIEKVDLVHNPAPEHDPFKEPEFSERLSRYPRLRRWIRRARGLELHSWLSERPKKGRSRNLKLIWRNDEGTQFTFATEQGQKARSVNIIELAWWLSHALKPLTPSEQLTVVEKSVFTSLERKQLELLGDTSKDSTLTLSRKQLVDRAQSLLRRARRQGATHSAAALCGQAANFADQLVGAVLDQGMQVVARGTLSDGNIGIVAATNELDSFATVLHRAAAKIPGVGIGVTLIDATQRNADDLWISVEATGRDAASQQDRPVQFTESDGLATDLNHAVTNAYTALQTELPPRVSFRVLSRIPAREGVEGEELYRIMLDGLHDLSSELQAQSGYHSVALSIALDYSKVSAACNIAQQLAATNRKVPVFVVHVSTDAAVHDEFLDFVLSEVSDSGIGTDRLCLELRDSNRLRDSSRASDFARTVRSIGCRIGISQVDPTRGSTAQLEVFSPHVITLDDSLWQEAEDRGQLNVLHQTITDLHHLVDESVVLHGDFHPSDLPELGVDHVEVVGDEDISVEDFLTRMPAIDR